MFPVLDGIESLDWGAYYDFRHNVNHPTLVSLVTAGYYFGLYGTFFFALLAVLLFLRQKRHRAVFMVVVACVVAYAAIEAMRFLVPRLRPTDTHLFVGASGSYPSPVLLFLLAISLCVCALWRSVPSWTGRGCLILLATLITVAVCLCHLFLRIHWVTDVIGALAGGGLASWLACRLIATYDPAH